MLQDSESKSEFKITNHVLVPKFEILNAKEAREIFKKYNAKPEHLPCILSSDPAIREIGAKPGDLVKITRRSETVGEAMYFRYVVES